MRVVMFVLLVVGLYSCTSNVDLAIDNPTDQPITVSVDSLTVQVPGNEVVWVEMGKGEHSVTLEDGTVEKFDYTKKAYLLNPTRAEYLIEPVFFGDETSLISYMASNNAKDSITYMGIPFDGTYSKFSDLITPVTWDVGARENMPETIEADAGESYVVLKKLYDPKEFMGKLMEALRQGE